MTEQQQAVRVQAWLLQDGKVATMRERLASVSEFMKYLSQPIARRANIEGGCTGKFWESRFKCQLLDDAAVLSAVVCQTDRSQISAISMMLFPGTAGQR